MNAFAPRRKVFISYHHDDQLQVNRFIQTFDVNHDVFIARAVGVMGNDIVNSTNSDYIMRRIREQYLADSTVTLVLIGRCTWSRRYVDWEIASTLRDDAVNKRSGLTGMFLPEYSDWTREQLIGMLPPRLKDNFESGYAKCYRYPDSIQQLRENIEDAFDARNARSGLVVNNRGLFSNNRTC